MVLGYPPGCIIGIFLIEMRVVIFEDNEIKYIDVKDVLNSMGITEVTWVTNVADGISYINDCLENEKVVDFIITDMNFPLCYGVKPETFAGNWLGGYFRHNKIKIPIIICSTMSIDCDDVYGCIQYGPDTDLWKEELRRMLLIQFYM